MDKYSNRDLTQTFQMDRTQTPMGEYASPDEAMRGFGTTLLELMTALTQVFPECIETKTMLIAVQNVYDKSALLEPIIEQWHEDLSEFYVDCDQGNVDRILNSGLGIIEQLRIKEKWFDPEFGEVSQNHLLKYIKQLNSYALIYYNAEQQYNVFQQLNNAVPPKIMQRLQSVASDIAEGRQNFTNPFSMAENLMEEFTDEDLQDFTQRIPEILQTVQGMQSLPYMSQAATANGLPDVSQLLGMLNGIGNSSIQHEE